jgi:hypothetical protein
MITKKDLSLVLAPPSHMTTDGDHNLHQKVFFSFWHSYGEVFRHSNSWYPKPAPKGVFCISTFWHFDIPVVKCFDTSNSQYLKLAPKGFFRILAFWHFDIPMVKCFDTSNSRYLKLAPKGVFSHFVILAFQHFCDELF